MEYLIVIDFEANCIENGKIYPQEITEFPAVPICINTNKILYNRIFHHYIKIENKLTRFASELTGITQEICDSSFDFKNVFKLFKRWCYDNKFTKYNSIIVTCGDWDFKTAFPNQCEYSNIKVPTFCKRWCNVKNIYKEVYKEKAGGMVEMLAKLNIKLDGKHHSGIDDSKNIAKICLHLLKKNGIFL